MAKKILIIDDDKIFSKILKDGLTKGGVKHEVTVAHDGEEGLEKVKQERPDLIILDMMMPKVGGIEFLKKMKLFNITPQIPVIVGSQLMDVEKISESVELGVKGYIVKSDFSLDNIIKQVENILNKEG
ncbi:MAG: response regulator [bacterium]|nr:response regulator [bacterium]